MNDEPKTTPPPLPLRVVPEPALMWNCPSPGCGKASAIPGGPIVRGFMMGRRLRITCRACNTAVELVPQEQPRIVVPGVGQNREQRRAAEAIRRKGGDDV